MSEAAESQPTDRNRAALGRPVRFESVGKSYGSTAAVKRVDLDIPAGEFLTLLGPSGSGKTTTLMMLAGFETPTSGEIFVGDGRLTNVRPAQRNIGMVFQSYALFPHMTVFENIAFPLKMRGMSASEQKKRVEHVLSIVDLGPLGNRYPRQLSGGQQQRVALARAIVFEPPVLLMDEPLSALDKYLRSHLQIEIKRIQRELGITVVYVTHDQDEAMTMSDRICVMSDGEIRQVDTPEALYNHPADEFVAGFLGESNMLDARLEVAGSDRLTVGISGARIDLPVRKVAENRDLKISLRPEHIRLTTSAEGSQPVTEVTIENVIYVGDHRRYGVKLPGGGIVYAKQQIVGGVDRFELGDRALLHWPIEEMRVFSSGKALS